MFRNKKKNQNNQYGTFALAKKRFVRLRKTSILAILAVILILGLAGVLFKYGSKPKLTQVADTKPLEQIPGWWQQQYFGSSVCQQDICQDAADPDKDGLNNFQEYFYHTDPLNSNTVKDKLNDGQLVAQGFDPSRPGHMTFDQVAAPENLLGESLVFSKDIQQIVAEANDINRVNLPLVKDDQLQVVDSHDVAAYTTYATRLQSTIDKYFPQNDIANLKTVLDSADESSLNDIKLKSEALATELTNLPVPIQFLMFHKYTIALFQLLPKVITAPASLTSTESDIWYDNFQSFLVVQQKLDLEELRLKQLMQANP